MRSFEMTLERIAAWYDAETAAKLRDLVEEGFGQLDCVDNFRAALLDDYSALSLYGEEGGQGCCGSVDTIFKIPRNGYEISVLVGCNYGH